MCHTQDTPSRTVEMSIDCFFSGFLFAATLPDTDGLRHPILHVRDSEGEFSFVSAA